MNRGPDLKGWGKSGAWSPWSPGRLVALVVFVAGLAVSGVQLAGGSSGGDRAGTGADPSSSRAQASSSSASRAPHSAGKPQDLTIWDCKTCHSSKFDAIELPGGHSYELCLVCHPQNPKVMRPGKGHRTKPNCLRCHDPEKLAPPVTAIVSERAWNHENGEGKGSWGAEVKPALKQGRGVHAQADLSRCLWCHDPHDAAAPHFPPGVQASDRNCAPSCHAWVDGTVVQPGFTNQFGVTPTYSGTIRPGELLGTVDNKHSNTVYAQNGCAGKCHNLVPNPIPTPRHGTITLCRQCHNYDWNQTVNKQDNLHDTHATLVGGEGPLADPADNQPGGVNTSCRYCHPSGTETLGKAACWNCHLSAHAPVLKDSSGSAYVPYWKATP